MAIAIYKNGDDIGEGEVVVTLNGVPIDLEGVMVVELWNDDLDDDEFEDPDAAEVATMGLGEDLEVSDSEEPTTSTT